ncbi:MAG: 3-methyladenine DNA glycosylase [Candidatus Competibacterales bacterium]
MTAPGQVLLDATAWGEAMARHEARLAPVLDPYLAARRRGVKDPVLDFLFEYYPFRPVWLRRWSPGVGVVLVGPGREGFLARHEAYVSGESGVYLEPRRVPERRREGVRWMVALLKATRGRPPVGGCYGFHEWAMVYGLEAGAVRPAQLPLRLSPTAIAAAVEARALVCTHYDAFRFFTPAAQPRNRHALSHANRLAHEQPGCLHANMDLYRWAFKAYPWVGSELIADAFFLARQIRTVDMRASPYDLTAWGLDPIAVETPWGRREYQAHQRRFYRAAQPLRDRLIQALEDLMAPW